jgi:hypothetical protein
VGCVLIVFSYKKSKIGDDKAGNSPKTEIGKRRPPQLLKLKTGKTRA